MAYPQEPSSFSPREFRKERRYFPRWPVQHRVLYRKKEEPFFRECLSKDISADGACFYAEESLDGQSPLTLALFLSEDMAVYVSGNVIWNHPYGERSLIGIRFDNVTQKVQDIILKYAFDLKKETLRKDWFEGWKIL